MSSETNPMRSAGEPGARDLAVVILAAGQGTRMKSRRPKVLHEICGRPMLGYPLGLSESLSPSRILTVVGHAADEVTERFAGRTEFVLQAEQRGTGHAVLQTEPKLRDFAGEILILYGDVPLLRRESIDELAHLKRATGAGLALLSAKAPLPGRVVRDARGHVERIVEITDAKPEEQSLEEGNTGVYLVDAELLWEALARTDDDNAQGEIYLTDVVAYAVEEGRGVEALRLEEAEDSLGVNTRAELAAAAAVIRRRAAARLMEAGVTLVDPDNTYIDVDVEIGRDTLVEPGCVIQGESAIGEGVHLKPGCHIESSRVDDGVEMGPYAHLRPGSHVMRDSRVGNFVELKNSTLGPGVKADHLSYIGDADVGAGSSFGCGSITVNYDWQTKSRTRVGEKVRVGCNANLIAPVELASNSAVAAGSTVTDDVPEDALAVARTRQANIEGWTARREGRAPAAGAKPAVREKATARSGSAKSGVGTRKKKQTTTRKKKQSSRKRTGKKVVGARSKSSGTSERSKQSKAPKSAAASRTAAKAATRSSKTGRKTARRASGPRKGKR